MMVRCDFCGSEYDDEEEGMFCEKNGKNYCLSCTFDDRGHCVNQPNCEGCDCEDCGFNK